MSQAGLLTFHALYAKRRADVTGINVDAVAAW
jgi:hypothetical protein